MSESSVRSSDIARLLEIVESAQASDDTEIFYSGVLRGLAELVPCDDLTFQLMDVPCRSCRHLTLTDGEIEATDDDLNEDPDPEDTARFWAAYWMPGGCSGGDSPDHTRVERNSDLFGDREYRSFPMGRLMADWGVQHKMVAAMQPFGVLDRRLLLFRTSGPDLTDREVGIVKLIRPHLAELHVRRQHELDGAPNLTHGSGTFCGGSHSARATPRSDGCSACQRPPFASTSRTSSFDSTPQAGPRPCAR